MGKRSLGAWAAGLTGADSALAIGLGVALQGGALQGERTSKRLATSRLHVRSGRLRNSIRGSVRTQRQGKTIELVITAGDRSVSYAGIQEKGGIVRAKGGGYLAIPLSPVKTRAGVARYASPRMQPGLFVIRSKAGNLLLVKRKGGGIESQWLLKKSVRITGRHYLRDGLQSAILHVRKRAPKVVGRVIWARSPLGGSGGV